MHFNEIKRNFNSQNLNSNLQWDRLKNTKGNVFIWFFAFLASKLIKFAGFEVIDPFVCSMRFFWYPYCYGLWHFMSYGMCHKMSWNGILWHFMTHAIWHKMSSTMALWVSKEPHRADILIYDFKTSKFYQFWGKKLKKSNEHISPLYFLADPFVNLNSNFGNWHFF